MTRNVLKYILCVAGFVSALGLTVGCYAQKSTDLRRISVVAPGFSTDSEEAKAFRDGLRGDGFVEGRNVSINWWFGNGTYTGVEAAVEKAIKDKSDVIVVESTVAALSAQRATQTIPIVMALVGDPEGVGLVETLGRPGGNITGLTNMSAELAAKRLQLLKQAVPSAKRVGVVWNPDTPLHSIGLAYLKSVAPQMQVELVAVTVRKVEQFGPAFSAMTRAKVDAVIALDDPFMTNHGAAFVRLAKDAHLPLAYGWKPLVVERTFHDPCMSAPGQPDRPKRVDYRPSSNSLSPARSALVKALDTRRSPTAIDQHVTGGGRSNALRFVGTRGIALRTVGRAPVPQE